jgi:hypothetical protein
VIGMGTGASAEGPHQQDRSGTSAGHAPEFVEQLRSAPAEEVIAEAFLVLLNAGQIKLGRRDARLLIDLSAVMLEHAGTYLPDGFAKQVEQSLGQLRLAQVSAENEGAKKGQPEPNDLSRSPTPPAGHARDQQRADDGYWFPLSSVDALGSRAMTRSCPAAG